MEEQTKQEDSPHTEDQSVIAEFWDFLKVRKKFWMGPIIMVLLALGALIVFTEGSAMSAFIYTLF